MLDKGQLQFYEDDEDNPAMYTTIEGCTVISREAAVWYILMPAREVAVDT